MRNGGAEMKSFHRCGTRWSRLRGGIRTFTVGSVHLFLPAGKHVHVRGGWGDWQWCVGWGYRLCLPCLGSTANLAKLSQAARYRYTSHVSGTEAHISHHHVGVHSKIRDACAAASARCGPKVRVCVVLGVPCRCCAAVTARRVAVVQTKWGFNSPRNLFREGTPCVCLLGYPLCCGVPGFFVPATRACFVSVPACFSPAVSVLLVVRGGCWARACLRQAQHRQRSPCREQPGAGDRHRLGWLLQGLVGGLHSRGRFVAFAALLPSRRPRCLWRASAPRPHLDCPRGVIPDSFTTAARPLAVPLEHHAVCFGRLCMMGR